MNEQQIIAYKVAHVLAEMMGMNFNDFLDQVKEEFYLALKEMEAEEKYEKCTEIVKNIKLIESWKI